MSRWTALEWEPIGREPSRDVADVAVGPVAPLALVVAERPARWERRPTGQLAIAGDELGQPADRDVVPQRTAGERELDQRRPGAVVHVGVDAGDRVVRVLVEREDVAVGVEPDEDRDGAVQRVLSGAPRATGIAVPQPVRRAAQVDRRCLLAEPRQSLGRADGEPGRPRRGPAQRRQLVPEQCAVGCEEPHRPVAADRHPHGRRRHDAGRPVVGPHRHDRAANEARVGQRPRDRRITGTPREPEDVVGQATELELRLGKAAPGADGGAALGDRVDRDQATGITARRRPAIGPARPTLRRRRPDTRRGHRAERRRPDIGDDPDGERRLAGEPSDGIAHARHATGRLRRPAPSVPDGLR